MNKILSIVVLGLLSSLLTNCAPDRARAIREDRSLTLGLPGVSYRPNGDFSLGAKYGHAKSTTSVDTSKTGFSAIVMSPDEDDAEENEDVRDVRVMQQTFTGFAQFFPWDTSAFFVGISGSYTQASFRFDEERQGSTALTPLYTEVNYETQSNHVGVPVGWAWIWESGFSFTFDLGPLFRVSHAGEFTRSGENDEVNAEKRDETIKTIDSLNRNAMIGATSGIIGWSF